MIKQPKTVKILQNLQDLKKINLDQNLMYIKPS